MKGKETKHLKAFVATRMQPGEQVLVHLEGYIGKMMGTGDNQQHNGSLIITDKRVAFMRKGLTGEVFESIAREKLSSIDEESTLSKRTLKFMTSGKTLRFTTLESQALVTQARAAAEGEYTPPPAGTPVGGPMEVGPREVKTFSKPFKVLLAILAGFFFFVIASAMTRDTPALGYGVIFLSIGLVALWGWARAKQAESRSASVVYATLGSQKIILFSLAFAVLPGTCLGLMIASEKAEQEEAHQAAQTKMAEAAPGVIEGATKDLGMALVALEQGQQAQADQSIRAANTRLDTISGLQDKPQGYAELQNKVGVYKSWAVGLDAHMNAQQLQEEGKHEEASRTLTAAITGMQKLESSFNGTGGQTFLAKMNALRDEVDVKAVESLKAAVQERLATGQEAYEAGDYERARGVFLALKQDLDRYVADPLQPAAFRTWSRETAPEVEKKLEAAESAKHIPGALAYFEDWNKEKRALRSEATDFADESGHQRVIHNLDIPLFHLKNLRDVAPDLKKKIPTKYRSASFHKSVEREVDRLKTKAGEHFAFLVACGSRPEFSGWDGGSLKAERLVKRSAHDPDSIDVENCTPPVLTRGKCWVYKCQVRGKNMFGAKILNVVTFQEDALTTRVLN